MRYISRAKLFYDEWDCCPSDGPRELTIFEAEESITGLLDQYGNPIIRQPDPIGFRLSDE